MRWKWKAYSVVKRAVSVTGFSITRSHFYSPIPGPLGEDVWTFQSPLRGVRMDLDDQLEWIAGICGHLGEFRPPLKVDESYTFGYDNGYFGVGDADVLYGVVRSYQPRRIVELGSGHTSAVIQLALAANTAEGAACDYQIYDPFPAAYQAEPVVPHTVHATPAELVADSVLSELESGDLLFVDTTHTVRLGGDVIRIIVEGLPLLAPGVVVHFHDIYLPYAYPRRYFEENEYYWSEQYLLQAFLSFNRDFEVLAGLYALAQDRPADLARVIPSMHADGEPVSFWLRRV